MYTDIKIHSFAHVHFMFISNDVLKKREKITKADLFKHNYVISYFIILGKDRSFALLFRYKKESFDKNVIYTFYNK